MNDKLRNFEINNNQIIKICILALLIASWTACKQQTKEHIPVIEYIYTQYENGVPKEIGLLQDSVKQGLWITFYPTGSVQFLDFYTDGKQTGPQRAFHENGRLASYHEMLNGKDHGKHMTYYRSGQIANEFFTVNNTIDGIITEYSENGEILRQFEYRKGTFYRALEGIFVEVEE